MELREAIQAVLKILPRGKDQQTYQYVRFLPGEPEKMPNRLFVTDGICGAVVKVDSQVPNVLIEARLLSHVVKDVGSLEMREVGYGKVEILSGVSKYKVEATDHDDFPAPPDWFQNWTPISDETWKVVSKVFSGAAVVKDASSPDAALAVVNFTPMWVEATDKAQLVRAEVEWPWVGRVSARLFKSWPSGSVRVAAAGSRALFRVEDEVRFAPLTNNPYPDTKNIIPPRHAGPSVLTHTRGLEVAVRQGAALSEMGLVNLKVVDHTIQVLTWNERKTDAYSAEVPLVVSSPEKVEVLVNGKLLQKILEKSDTPVVRLGYGTPLDPLRVESGALVACLWPMV